MAVVLHMDPTTVNILTDIFLLVLQVIWIRVMVVLTELDMKRNIRNGRRVFSFENIGSVSYLTHGWRKFRKLKRKNVLTRDEQFQFRIYIGISLISLLFTISLILMHVLIDYGLDYTEVIQPTNTTAEFGMTGLFDNSEMVTLMSRLNFSEQLNDCIEREQSIDICRASVDAQESMSFERLREGMSFARVLYHTPSVAQVDFLEGLKLDYKCIDLEDSKLVRPDCKFRAFTNAWDFDGNFNLTKDDCVLQKFFVREVKIDMRAQRTVRTTTAGLGNANLLRNVDTEGNTDSQVEYSSFKSFKDENQEASTVSLLTPEEGVGKLDVDYNYAELIVDSHVNYEPGAKQTVKLVDMVRMRRGRFADTKTALSLREDRNVDRPADRTYLYLTPFDAKESNAYELELELYLVENVAAENEADEETIEVFCDRFSASWVSVKRQRSIEVYKKTEDGTEAREFGFDIVNMIVAVDEQSECGKRVLQRYEEVIDKSISGESTALFVGFSFEIACVPRSDVDDKLWCQYGPKKLYYDGESWVTDPEIIQSKNLTKIDTRSEVYFIRVEVEGGDPSVVNKALRNVEKIFKLYYPELNRFSHRGSMRGRIFAGRLNTAMREIIFGISTQVSSQPRAVKTGERKTVAVLLPEYIIGLITVLTVTVVAMLVALARFIREYWIYRKLNVSVKVPMTTTEWIHSVLVSSSTFPSELGLGYAYTYEFLMDPPREEGGREVVTGSFRQLQPQT
uniref:Uncharacterized protein n=1 Tax=Rhodosorus marinus TaxID=101924 RepID=A0A7S0BSY0_9RHOD|mmetsp:Transcript_7998/g.11844  ORF Transcript_7998/g.11844 Transcript_7998/m.11844 type:complete len:736 (+) Transcript_7998:405-2612(+)|eukprot:CAMPEP_0184745864 /NCGR_PEP_ID=MMETSP0315-20130426/8526_1 /TAXON_ID=101924 /ORGANISM="Rhodosorus marinus, Strain UTEX LB 2760" /LENGTH=735 /DNA_ID=CAMNT_0027218235 /DNA_START=389 /DNA_END=2596 /DNA_ORIENTATION=+